MELIKKYRLQVGLFAVIVVMLVIVSAIKASRNIGPDLPGAATDDRSIEMYKAIARTYRPLAENSWFEGRAEFAQQMQRIIDMDDQTLIGVHNAYKNLYRTKAPSTLRALIQDQYATTSFFLKQRALERLSEINA